MTKNKIKGITFSLIIIYSSFALYNNLLIKAQLWTPLAKLNLNFTKFLLVYYINLNFISHNL